LGGKKEKGKKEKVERELDKGKEVGLRDYSPLPSLPPKPKEQEVVNCEEETRKKSAAVAPSSNVALTPSRAEAKGGRGGLRTARPRQTTRRPPRTAAVALTCVEDTISYAKALRRAREGISLQDLGIEETRVRCVITGGFLIEISSEGMKEKADSLSEKMKEILKDTGVKIERPMRMADIRISELDDSVTPANITRSSAGLETLWNWTSE